MGTAGIEKITGMRDEVPRPLDRMNSFAAVEEPVPLFALMFSYAS